MRRENLTFAVVLALLVVFSSAFLVMAGIASSNWVIEIDGVSDSGLLTSPGVFCGLIDGLSGASVVANTMGPPTPLLVGQMITVTGDDYVHLRIYYTDGSEIWPEASGGTVSYIVEKSVNFAEVRGEGDVSVTCGWPDDDDSGDGWLFRDGRLNANTPNAPVVFYATDDGMVVYSSDNTGLVLAVDVDFLATHGDENPLWSGVWMVDGEPLPIAFYKLPTGEYQFMIGPDPEGNVYVNVFDAMPPTKATNISYNIYGSSCKW